MRFSTVYMASRNADRMDPNSRTVGALQWIAAVISTVVVLGIGGCFLAVVGLVAAHMLGIG